MPEEDPATNPDFITLRELKANEAALEAKRMFIEYVRTEISASDIVTLPETPLGTDFDNKKNAVTDKVNKALRKYKKALRTLDKSEHKKNKGIGFDELVKEGIIAGIQKIKPDFDPSKVEQKKY
jgi:chemotaxis response regulator CheB